MTITTIPTTTATTAIVIPAIAPELKLLEL